MLSSSTKRTPPAGICVYLLRIDRRFCFVSFFLFFPFTSENGADSQITSITGDAARKALDAGEAFEARLKRISVLKGADLEEELSDFR